MVDVIDRAVAVANIDQRLYHTDDVRPIGREERLQLTPWDFCMIGTLFTHQHPTQLRRNAGQRDFYEVGGPLFSFLGLIFQQILQVFLQEQAEIDTVKQYARHFAARLADPAIELHATHGREIVAIFGKEQILEQVFRCVFGRRFTRAHHAVDLDLGFELGTRAIRAQRLRNVGAMIEIVCKNRLDGSYVRDNQLGKQVFCDLRICIGNQFPGLLVDNIPGERSSHGETTRNDDFAEVRLLNVADMSHGNASFRFHNHVAIGIGQIEIEGHAT